MPKIKAYVGNGNIIAVDDAAIVNAFRCPWTDNIFTRKSDYIKHLAGLREWKIHKKIRHNNRIKIISGLWCLTSFEDIINWFPNNSKFVFENSRSSWRNAEKACPDDFKFEITYLDLTWNKRVSNSHSCPHNGVTNFRGDNKFKDGTLYPTGYPGWSGRIEFRSSHDLGWAHETLEQFRIHTGTGGGCGIDRPAGYEVRFFDADWPGLAARTAKEYESYSSHATMERLKDNDVIPFNQTFRYGKAHYFGR